MEEIMLGSVNDDIKRTDAILFNVLKRKRDTHFIQKEVKGLVGVRGGREKNLTFDVSSLGKGKKFRGISVSVLDPRHREPYFNSETVPQAWHRSSSSKPEKTISCSDKMVSQTLSILQS